ncbi:MAG TPA: flagellar basal body L-ring protein FlgH [Limnochordia bacterium]
MTARALKLRGFQCAALLLLLIGWGGWVRADSLWVPGASLYADERAHAVGDLVTLIIVERTEASQSANTTTAKDASVTVSPGSGALDGFLPLVGASGSDEVTAGGSTQRGGSLEAKITTKIVEVLPNGNFALEGRQTILLNGEEQEIVVSGIVRPQDIGPDNTVLSTYLADARISYRGSGIIGDKQKPGLLSRLFGWLF